MSDAAMWKRRCERYEKHMAEHIPQELWPEFFKPAADPKPLSDETIRAVIQAWERTGMMTEQGGQLSAYVCDRVRDQIKAGPPA